MKKIKSNFDKFTLIATLSGFIFSAGSCDKGSKENPTAGSDSSFTAEEVKTIKENLLKDGQLSTVSYPALVSAVAALQKIDTDNTKNNFTPTGVLTSINGIYTQLINLGIIALKADKSGYELTPAFAEAKKLTPEAVELANSFSKALKSSTAFNTTAPLKIQVAANTCNVISISA